MLLYSEGSGQLSTGHDLTAPLAFSTASCASPRQWCGRPALEGHSKTLHPVPSMAEPQRRAEDPNRSSQVRGNSFTPTTRLRQSELRSCAARASAATDEPYSASTNKALELDAEQAVPHILGSATRDPSGRPVRGRSSKALPAYFDELVRVHQQQPCASRADALRTRKKGDFAHDGSFPTSAALDGRKNFCRVSERVRSARLSAADCN